MMNTIVILVLHTFDAATASYTVTNMRDVPIRPRILQLSIYTLDVASITQHDNGHLCVSGTAHVHYCDCVVYYNQYV